MSDSLLQDLRYAFRTLRRSPGFAAIAILTIAMGIGANTAIFSVVQAVLLRPLPYADPAALVYVRGALSNRAVFNWPISPRILLDMRERSSLVGSFGGLNSGRGTLIDREGRPTQIEFGRITPNLFSLLGVRPALGRDFTAEDATPIAADADPNSQPTAAVMLSDRIWRTRFGADPEIVGSFIDFLGGELEVIGVMPPGFEILIPADSRFSTNLDAWLTPRLDLVNADRRGAMFEVIARMRPGVTGAQVQGEMDAVVAFIHEINEASRGAGYDLRVTPMQTDITAEIRPLVLALLGAVGFVMLIACANVSNLLMVRASTRAGEIAIRSAVGGSRGRLFRQLLTESLMLAASGAVVGVLLARMGIRWLLALGPPEFPRMESVGIDATVLLFTLALSLVAAVVFGTVPALHASRAEIADVLKYRGRSAALAGRALFRNGVLVTEVALSLVLLIGAGLMIRSFVGLQRAEPGFETNRALTFELQLQGPDYPQGRRIAFVDELRERLTALPGVEAVTAGIALPLHGAGALGRYGTEKALEDDALYGQANYRTVYLDYFRTLGTPLLEGRVFEPADFGGEGAQVVVVDEILARRTWANDSAVGKTLVIRRGPEPELMEVIGVVRHQRSQSPALDSKETVYFNARNDGDPRTQQWFLRTGVDPASLGDQVRAAVAAIDPALPVSNLRTMQSVVNEVMSPTRFALVLIAVFAALAAVLASIGLYSVLAYVVRQRTAEIGLRMVFGARPGDVLSLLLHQAMVPTFAGIALGLVAAFWLTRFMSSLLVEVAPTDPATFVTVALLFIGIAALASAVPVRRATRIDPIESLRGE